MRKRNWVRVHHEKKSDGVRIDHEEKSNEVTGRDQSDSDL